MREIKFRVWDKRFHRMIPGHDVTVYGNNCWDATRCDESGDEIETLDDESKDGVLMQFTGLKDKNGKDIYEGDIVRFTMSGKEYQRPVVWNPAGMWSIEWNGTPNPGPMRGEYEVIGNIHEHPELLTP